MKKIKLDFIDERIQAGPFSESWDSLENYSVPKWYEVWKVWNFYSLGPLCCSSFWQRMVSPKYVPSRVQRFQTSSTDIWQS